MVLTWWTTAMINVYYQCETWRLQVWYLLCGYQVTGFTDLVSPSWLSACNIISNLNVSSRCSLALPATYVRRVICNEKTCNYFCEFVIYETTFVAWRCLQVSPEQQMRAETHYEPASVCLLWGGGRTLSPTVASPKRISLYFPDGSGDPLKQGGWKVISYWTEMHSYVAEQSLEGVIFISHLTTI